MDNSRIQVRIMLRIGASRGLAVAAFATISSQQTETASVRPAAMLVPSLQGLLLLLSRP
jgi:hypothetical protein